MSDATTMSNEVLLAAFASVQVLTTVVAKVVDYFIDRSRLDPVDEKLDTLLVSDKERNAGIQAMILSKANDSRLLNELYTMHKVIDEDGRPAWYFPKKMIEMSEKHLEMLRDISMAQKQAAHEMGMIVKQLSCMRTKKDDN